MKSDQEGDYVTRSQAAELLAAERAESNRLAGIASEQMARAEQTELKERWLREMVTTVISNQIGSVQHYRAVEDARLALGNPEAALSENEKLIQRAQKAEADNAALTARVKELENVVKGAGKIYSSKNRKIEELGFKLATAEKALEPFAKELSDRHDKSFRLEPAPDSECVGFTQLTYGHFRKARAVLGGKP